MAEEATTAPEDEQVEDVDQDAAADAPEGEEGVDGSEEAASDNPAAGVNSTADITGDEDEEA